MHEIKQAWHEALDARPLIAILRGIAPAEVLAVADALFSSGFRILEIPLNSPEPLRSIEMLVAAYPDRIIGAGTVTGVEQVEQCHSVGCRIVVAPNFDPDVASAALAAGMIYCPGVATPSEAFSALAAGAHALKLFPAEMLQPTVVKAMRAVLPTDAVLLPVGGISPANMSEYLAAGAGGFGIGSALYKPGKSLDDIVISAQAFVRAFSRGAEGLVDEFC